ncbi:hypothetical protein, partial [Duncaniella muris]|uniref:hypothetical protein n=1 Tax=Duncaniella muris TaxID=2094150 RepID=UPI0026769C73
ISKIIDEFPNRAPARDFLALFNFTTQSYTISFDFPNGIFRNPLNFSIHKILQGYESDGSQ